MEESKLNCEIDMENTEENSEMIRKLWRKSRLNCEML